MYFQVSQLLHPGMLFCQVTDIWKKQQYSQVKLVKNTQASFALIPNYQNQASNQNG